MFDNPRKELERLQQELLAAEEPEQPEEPEADFDFPMEWDEEERAPLSHSYTDVGDDTRIWETPEESRPPTFMISSRHTVPRMPGMVTCRMDLKRLQPSICAAS